MQLELIYNSIDGLVRKSRLNLVDLAGSERIGKTGAEGQRLKEAQKINQSLTTLGMVIMALTTEGIKHVPFRNSKLTLILKDSLGGSSKTTLLCTASRLKRHTEESIQTLYFASRAKTIKNSAKKNIILNAGELQYIAKELKNEIMILRGQIKKIGYQWKLIDDKKLLNFIQNDEFILNDNNSENLIEIKKEDKKNEEKINEKNEKNILNLNNLSEKEKDEKIEELKKNMNIQREKLQKIIDELFIKIDNRDKEQSELQNKIEDYIKQISNLQIIFQEKKNLQNKYNNLKNELSEIKNNISNKNKNIEKYKNENLKLNNDLLDLKKNNEINFKKSQEEFLKFNNILIEKKKKI
jgi:kinesin family protein 5